MSALSARLEAVKNLVRQGSVAADIGTDHAYLICALVNEDICPRGFACDINAGPLERAEKTIAAARLSRKIKTVLTNGLSNLPLAEIDDIIIAGMGGDLIGEILLAAPKIRDARFRFILQPMTKADHLRKILCENGFLIEKETAVREGSRFYTVMPARYTGIPKTPDGLYIWAGCLLENRDKASAGYLLAVAKRLEKKAAGLMASANPEGAAYYDSLARTIRERMCRNV